MTDPELLAWVDAWSALYPVEADEAIEDLEGVVELDLSDLQRIVNWKFPGDRRRLRRTTDLISSAGAEQVRQASRDALASQKDLDALLNLERIKGLGPAIASSVLAAARPDRFSVIDWRALASVRALGLLSPGRQRPANSDWEPFLTAVRALAGRLNQTLRRVDRALFASAGQPGLPAARTNPVTYPVLLSGHIGVWTRAVEVQAQRVLNENQPNAQRHVEAFTFAISLRQLIRGLKAMADATGDPKLLQVYKEYLASVPGLKEIRDVLTHFEDYEAGRGRLQQGGRLMTPLNIFAERGERRFLLRINHLMLDVGAAAEGAGDLQFEALQAEQRFRMAHQSPSLRAPAAPVQ